MRAECGYATYIIAHISAYSTGRRRSGAAGPARGALATASGAPGHPRLARRSSERGVWLLGWLGVRVSAVEMALAMGGKEWGGKGARCAAERAGQGWVGDNRLSMYYVGNSRINWNGGGGRVYIRSSNRRASYLTYAYYHASAAESALGAAPAELTEAFWCVPGCAC